VFIEAEGAILWEDEELDEKWISRKVKQDDPCRLDIAKVLY
jgi:hypothetical protein